MPTLRQTVAYTFTGTQRECEEYQQRLEKAMEPALDPFLHHALLAGLLLVRRNIEFPAAEEE